MRVLFCVFLAIIVSTSAQAAGQRQDEFFFTGAGFKRTISSSGGLLNTPKLEVNGENILAQPSVEFMLEMEVNGEMVTLVPRHFDIDSLAMTEANRTRQIEITMKSNQDEYPIYVYVRYYTNPDWPYVQKNILVKPLKTVRGATLKRVVIEDFVLAPGFTNTPGSFAVTNTKTGKGFFCFVASPYGTERLGNVISLAQDFDQPLSTQIETARVTMGIGSSAEAIDQAFRNYLWTTYCAGRSSTAKPDAACADVGLDVSSTADRVKLVGEFAQKCGEARKSHADQAVCAVPAKAIQPSDVHLLALADLIKVDLATATSEDYIKTREKLLKVFPPQTLRFTPADPPAPANSK